MEESGFSSVVAIANCIVANNSVPGGSPFPDVGLPTGNLIFDHSLLGSNSPVLPQQFPAGNLIAQPQLGVFQENGGPTQTLLPAVTSPVIGAGDPSALNTAGPGGQTLLVDQRGNPHPNTRH